MSDAAALNSIDSLLTLLDIELIDMLVPAVTL